MSKGRFPDLQILEQPEKRDEDKRSNLFCPGVGDEENNAFT